MERRKVIIRAALILAAVWLLVFAISSWASSRKATADAAAKAIASARLADWSENSPDNAAEAARREKEIRRIADLVNRLDYQEREKAREARTLESAYRNLNSNERRLFIDLTIRESMNQFMAALDAMTPAERHKFVERSLKQIEKGRTAEDMQRAKDMDPDLLNRITSEGMRAYFEKADTNTKLDLAPLMESMNDIMKGMQGGGHADREGPPGS